MVIEHWEDWLEEEALKESAFDGHIYLVMVNNDGTKVNRFIVYEASDYENMVVNIFDVYKKILLYANELRWGKALKVLLKAVKKQRKARDE